MSAALTILFPWRGTFEHLGLKKHWWHRLAVVAFVIALVLVLGTSWVITFGSLQPDYSHMPGFQYWEMDAAGNPEQVTLGPPVTQAQHDAAVKQHKEDAKKDSIPLPVGSQVLIAPPGVSIDWSAPLKEKVYMPDGTTGEFDGKSDAEITMTWNTALHKAVRKQWLLSTGITIALILFFSYLLQSLYRALLYVVYGSTKGRNLTQTGEPA